MSDPISIPTAASSSNGQATGQASSPSARSLRSVSSTNSPPPNLDTDSLALLSQFRSQKAKQQAKFARLEAKAKREERERKKRAGVVEGAEREEVEDGEEDDEEQGFAESEAWGDLERLARLEAGEVLSDEEDNGDGATEDGDDDDDGIMTVGAWRDLVSEDYQQSQFWYSEFFAYELARVIHARLERLASLLPAGRNPRIAFVCSPTAFVAFQDLYGERTSGSSSNSNDNGAQAGAPRRWKSGRDMFLLEIDERFTVAARHGGFIRYDFNVPLKGLAPLAEDEGVDMVVIDPPFLNEKTTDRVAQSVHYLLGASPLAKSREASILLLTGDSIAGYAKDVYPLPEVEGQGVREPLRRTPLVVEHEGGRLSNEFGAWCSWAWE